MVIRSFSRAEFCFWPLRLLSRPGRTDLEQAPAHFTICPSDFSYTGFKQALEPRLLSQLQSSCRRLDLMLLGSVPILLAFFPLPCPRRETSPIVEHPRRPSHFLRPVSILSFRNNSAFPLPHPFSFPPPLPPVSLTSVFLPGGGRCRIDCCGPGFPSPLFLGNWLLAYLLPPSSPAIFSPSLSLSETQPSSLPPRFVTLSSDPSSSRIFPTRSPDLSLLLVTFRYRGFLLLVPP